MRAKIEDIWPGTLKQHCFDLGFKRQITQHPTFQGRRLAPSTCKGCKALAAQARRRFSPHWVVAGGSLLRRGGHSPSSWVSQPFQGRGGLANPATSRLQSTRLATENHSHTEDRQIALRTRTESELLWAFAAKSLLRHRAGLHLSRPA